ncbi:hypothetical protein LCGC14_1076260 [marine sediment metagenome]|uniref:Uncharacterized protein n=1 Tax=marine sediment metagenome TaxID=412755 RepID=A0A0F9N427_9ZZZZ
MTNVQVQNKFRNKESGKSQNLTSDGLSLWSYNWWECARWVDGKIVTRKGKSYSMTTATKHRSGVYGVEATEETPVGNSFMNL